MREVLRRAVVRGRHLVLRPRKKDWIVTLPECAVGAGCSCELCRDVPLLSENDEGLISRRRRSVLWRTSVSSS